MNNSFVPPSLLGAGVIVVLAFAYIIGSTLLGNPADLTTTAASTDTFRTTLWLDRALDVLVQGAVVFAGVVGVVVLLRGIRV